MEPEDYSKVDDLLFDRGGVWSEEDLTLVVDLLGEIRTKTFDLVRANGIDPYSLSCWSGCCGSFVELSAFIDEAIEMAKTGERRNPFPLDCPKCDYETFMADRGVKCLNCDWVQEVADTKEK